MTRTLLLRAAPLGLALPLAACFSFGAKPPPTLMTLSPETPIAVGQTQRSTEGSGVLILVPVVSQALATARVPVQTTGTDIQYLKNAQWVEPPQRLFARLLSDTVTARTGRVVLSTAQSMADPGIRLNGELRNFGLDAATSEAVVTFDGAIMRGAGTTVEKRRFEARVPVTELSGPAAGPAINQAANRVAGEVADWIGRG